MEQEHNPLEYFATHVDPWPKFYSLERVKPLATREVDFMLETLGKKEPVYETVLRLKSGWEGQPWSHQEIGEKYLEVEGSTNQQARKSAKTTHKAIITLHSTGLVGQLYRSAQDEAHHSLRRGDFGIDLEVLTDLGLIPSMREVHVLYSKVENLEKTIEQMHRQDPTKLPTFPMYELNLPRHITRKFGVFSTIADLATKTREDLRADNLSSQSIKAIEVGLRTVGYELGMVYDAQGRLTTKTQE